MGNPIPQEQPCEAAPVAAAPSRGGGGLCGLESNLAAAPAAHLIWIRKLFRADSDILTAVAPQAQVGLLLVAPEALDGAQARAVLAHLHRRLGRDLLVGAGLQELADPQPARVARRTERGQRVVGADHLVAVGDVGLRAEE